MAHKYKDLNLQIGGQSMSIEELMKKLGKLAGRVTDVRSLVQNIITSLEEAGKAAQVTTGKLVRTLAGFDQIQRLGKSTGSAAQVQDQLGTLTQALQELLEPAVPATEQLEQLQQQMEQLPQPSQLLQNALLQLGGSMLGLNSTVDRSQPGFAQLLNGFLMPLARWSGTTVLTALTQLQGQLDGVSQWADDSQSTMTGAAGAAGAFLDVWSGDQVGNWLTQAQGLPGFLAGLQGKIDGTSGSTADLESAIARLGPAATQAFREVTAGMGGMGGSTKDAANGVIAAMNSSFSAVFGGLNSALEKLGDVNLQFPDWLPGIGGKSFGFSFKPVTVPQIPYLAQGAVLPANRPFLAMVGDQRHGTNIEAPLSTIQEAVAAVMQDHTGILTAGFEASVQVQREILEAVLGIHIGDETIAQAARRYERKMAVVRGGAL